jgi:hypothetical protein
MLTLGFYDNAFANNVTNLFGNGAIISYVCLNNLPDYEKAYLFILIYFAVYFFQSFCSGLESNDA